LRMFSKLIMSASTHWNHYFTVVLSQFGKINSNKKPGSPRLFIAVY